MVILLLIGFTFCVIMTVVALVPMTMTIINRMIVIMSRVRGFSTSRQSECECEGKRQ